MQEPEEGMRRQKIGGNDHTDCDHTDCDRRCTDNLIPHGWGGGDEANDPQIDPETREVRGATQAGADDRAPESGPVTAANPAADREGARRGLAAR